MDKETLLQNKIDEINKNVYGIGGQVITISGNVNTMKETNELNFKNLNTRLDKNDDANAKLEKTLEEVVIKGNRIEDRQNNTDRKDDEQDRRIDELEVKISKIDAKVLKIGTGIGTVIGLVAFLIDRGMPLLLKILNVQS